MIESKWPVVDRHGRYVAIVRKRAASRVTISGCNWLASDDGDGHCMRSRLERNNWSSAQFLRERRNEVDGWNGASARA
jgi:hypothetical protein